jgi:hypothetical protein
MKPGTRTNKTEEEKEKENPISTAFLPYTQTTYGRLS